MEVQSPFGPRKVRSSVAGGPPQPSQSTDPSLSSSGTVNSPFGPRRVGSSATATDSSGTAPAASSAGASAGVFGPRVGNRGSLAQVGPSASGGGAAAESSSSAPPFGSVLRSRTQPPSHTSAPPPASTTVEPPHGAGKANRTVPFPLLERIEALLLWRRSQLHTMRLRVKQSVELIQLEYRRSLAALGDNAEERTRARRRRRAWLQERLRQRAAVALEGRQHGSAIAADEAREWLLIVASASSLKRREVEAREEAWRQEILHAESSEFQRRFHDDRHSVIPAFLRPGTLEHDEMVLRCHVARYFRFSLQRMARRAVAERAGVTLLDEQRLRRGVLEAEVVVRVQLLREMRFDYFASRLLELVSLERRLRSVREAQAVQLMQSAVRQTAALRAIHLISDDPEQGGPTCEVHHRRGIESKELFYRRQLEEVFRSQRCFLMFATVQREEYQGRCGAGGIEAKERREWKAIALSWSATLLARLQGNWETPLVDASRSPATSGALIASGLRIRENVYCDTSTEPGSRLTIEIAEARERRTIEASLSSEAVALFFPPIERRYRQKIATEELRERKKLVDSMHVLPLLFCTQSEPVARQRIENLWQAAIIQLMVEYAKLRLEGNELRIRAHYIQHEELHWERIQAQHYLCLVEIEERHELRRALRASLSVLTSNASHSTRTRRPNSALLHSPSSKRAAVSLEERWQPAPSFGDDGGDESPTWLHRGTDGAEGERPRQHHFEWRSTSYRDGTAPLYSDSSSSEWMLRTVREAMRPSQTRDGSAASPQPLPASSRGTAVLHRAISESVPGHDKDVLPELFDVSPRSRLHGGGSTSLDTDESLDGNRVALAPLAAGILHPTLRVTFAASPPRNETAAERSKLSPQSRPNENVYLRDPTVASLVGPYLARERIQATRPSVQPQSLRRDPVSQTAPVREQSPLRASSPTLVILPPRVAGRWE